MFAHVSAEAMWSEDDSCHFTSTPLTAGRIRPGPSGIAELQLGILPVGEQSLRDG